MGAWVEVKDKNCMFIIQLPFAQTQWIVTLIIVIHMHHLHLPTVF